MTTNGATANARPSSLAKRQAILAAAEEAFLDSGYDAVTMDDLADRSGVAKQTMYAHFGSKDALFVDLVTAMTSVAGDPIHDTPAHIEQAADVGPLLVERMSQQLDIVLTPRLLRLRRLVIGEVARFPALARALAEHGPHRGLASIEVLLRDLDGRGLLAVPEPRVAAAQLNWLVMGEPVNDAMLLGDDAVPSPRRRRAHVERAVATFLAAYAV